MKATERLYLTKDRSKLVGFGDPKAAFLYATEGDDIPESAVEKFGLVDGRLKPGRQSAVTLLGSSILPAMVEIAAGVSVQLGDVVARAHKASALDAEAWNALPDADREALLAAAVEAMRADPASITPRAPRPKAKRPPATKERKPAEDKSK